MCGNIYFRSIFIFENSLLHCFSISTLGSDKRWLDRQSPANEQWDIIVIVVVGFMLTAAIAAGKCGQVLLLLLAELLGFLIFYLHFRLMLLNELLYLHVKLFLGTEFGNVKVGAKLFLAHLPEDVLVNLVFLHLFVDVLDFEFLENLDYIVIGEAIALVLLLLGLLFHELYVDVGGNDSGVLNLGFSRLIVLLPNDDLVSHGLIGQVVSKDVLKLVACDRLLPDISDQFFPDEPVLDELLKDLSASLNRQVCESFLGFLVTTCH